ncbi:hypothetical protein R6Q57_019366 [Mikania cordata]
MIRPWGVPGRNQKGPDFWSKVRSHFFQTMGRGEYRTNDMISSKWRDINRKVKRFNEIYSKKWQTRRSSQRDALIESEAVDQFRQEFNTVFSLKRIGIPTVQPSTSKRSKVSSTDSPGSSDDRVQINLNELDEEEEDDKIEDLTRPIGRDRAKAGRVRARRDSSSQPIPDYTKGMENLSQRIGDFNKLKRERQRLVELQLLFTNTDHLTGIDREIVEREKEKIRNKYRDN